MARLLGKFFRSRRPAWLPAIPAGHRVYAIGDIHGRSDLFEAMVRAIEADIAASGDAQVTIILLGDLIDRGPDSVGILALARKWASVRDVRFISGNHEEMFLLSFFDRAAFKTFLRFGGVETLASYGIDTDALTQMDFADAKEEMARRVPKADRQFIRSFETSIGIGDYLFVHAGIHPKVPLNEQAGQDCRWIREPFLSHKGDFGVVVVHGHTVTENVEIRHNRIGIDTGAYMSGLLTALCLEGAEQRLIQVNDSRGNILATHVPITTDADAALAQAMPGSL